MTMQRLPRSSEYVGARNDTSNCVILTSPLLRVYIHRKTDLYFLKLLNGRAQHRINDFHRRPLEIQVPPELPLFLRSEEHTSELQSQSNLVCRLLLEKKNN